MAAELPASTVVRFAAFEVDLATGELRKHGIRIKLQDQPFQILAMLLERPGALVTRDQIQQRLWPADTFVDFEHGVNTAIRRLRDALSDDADTPRFIETLPRRGYRFLGEVRGIEAAEAPTAASAESPEPALHIADKTTPPVSAIRRWRSLWPIALIITIGIAALLAWRLWPRTAINSVAVLPFANESKDSGLDYVADGIPGRVIDTLSEIPGLRVASRNSAFTFRKVPVKPREVADSLHVRATVLGTIRRNGDLLQLNVELLDTRDDKHLWGAEYTVSSAQLATLDATIAREVAVRLHQRLTPQIESRLKPTTNSTAYDAFLRGDYMMDRRVNQNFRVALTYFQKAVDSDPNFALGYVGMQKAYALLADYGGMPAGDALALSEVCADRALALDPNLALAHASKGFTLLNYRRNVPAAQKEFLRALELNPNLAAVYQGYANTLEIQGRYDEAIAAIKRSEELDPLWYGYRAIHAYILTDARRFDEALRLREERPGLKKNYFAYAQVYAAAGRREEALAELAHLKFNEATSPVIYCVGARVLGMVGEVARGRELLKVGLELQKKLGPGGSASACSPSDAAAAYAALRDRSNMLASLDFAERNFDPRMQWITLNHAFDPYRSDPAFKEIVRRATTPR